MKEYYQKQKAKRIAENTQIKTWVEGIEQNL